MKMLRVPLLMIGLLLCSQGFAATAQQNKMTACNADPQAKSLKGDERKAFMSTCLKATPAANDAKVLTRSEEHTSELQSHHDLVCRLLLDTATTEIYTLSLHDALPI